jgi:hypothetical protein
VIEHRHAPNPVLTQHPLNVGKRSVRCPPLVSLVNMLLWAVLCAD